MRQASEGQAEQTDPQMNVLSRRGHPAFRAQRCQNDETQHEEQLAGIHQLVETSDGRPAHQSEGERVQPEGERRATGETRTRSRTQVNKQQHLNSVIMKLSCTFKRETTVY